MKQTRDIETRVNYYLIQPEPPVWFEFHPQQKKKGFNNYNSLKLLLPST